MRVRVIVPPDPIVTPADIAGSHAADDAGVAALIAAVTADIDGPGGWVGRAFGPQTLEASIDSWPSCDLRLPYRPIIDMVSVVYVDSDDALQTVSDADYFREQDMLWFRSGWSAPSLGRNPSPIRIRYLAGYNGVAEADGGTGEVDERARQAIIVTVQHLKATLAMENMFLRSKEIPDVGTWQYTVSDQAAGLVHKTTQSLLRGLEVYTL